MMHFGVVEDRWDPEEMGRVKVRVMGIHTDNLSEIPTDSLPWATVMTPTTSPSISEAMITPYLLPGSWVVVMFTDADYQNPVVIGSIPGKPAEKRSSNLGFSDPGNVYPTYTGRADTPFEARSTTYKESSTYTKKLNNRVTEVPTAVRPKITSVAPDKPGPEYVIKLWDEYPVMNDHVPRYPYNHVNKTEQGIVEEFDDTPGNKRISRMHPSGTYEEIYNDGSRALHVEGYAKVYIKKGADIFVEGNTNLTVKGDMTHYVTGNYKLEVGGDYTRQVHGSMQTKVAKNDEREILMNRSVNIGENDKLTVILDKITKVNRDYKITTGRDINFYTVRNHDNTVLGNLTELVFANYGQTNLGTLKITSKGNITVETPASMIENIDVNQTTTVGGTKTETAYTGAVTYNEGDVTADGVSLVGHTHGGVTSGLSSTGVPN